MEGLQGRRSPGRHITPAPLHPARQLGGLFYAPQRPSGDRHHAQPPTRSTAAQRQGPSSAPAEAGQDQPRPAPARPQAAQRPPASPPRAFSASHYIQEATPPEAPQRPRQPRRRRATHPSRSRRAASMAVSAHLRQSSEPSENAPSTVFPSSRYRRAMSSALRS